MSRATQRQKATVADFINAIRAVLRLDPIPHVSSAEVNRLDKRLHLTAYDGIPVHQERVHAKQAGRKP
jgi:hypothetical protein